MAERTFPSKGLSPIDAYTEAGVRSLGYFEGTNIQTTSGAYRSVEVISKYEPQGNSGFTTTLGFSSKVQLGDSVIFTGGAGYLWGVQAQLDFQDGATVNQVSSIFSALRGVITSAGTPVFSAFEGICGLYIDVLTSVDMSNIDSNYNSSGIFLNNMGTAYMDAAIRVLGGAWDNLFNLETCTRDGDEGIVHSVKFSGEAKGLSILIDGVEHRLTAWAE